MCHLQGKERIMALAPLGHHQRARLATWLLGRQRGLRRAAELRILVGEKAEFQIKTVMVAST